jgi:hypothetical protein
MKKLIMACLLLVIMTSITMATPTGFLFTSVTEPVSASSLDGYSKKATGSTMSILGLLGIGDASIETITTQAGISRVKHIDKNTTIWPFGIFIQETFTVYGD